MLTDVILGAGLQTSRRPTVQPGNSAPLVRSVHTHRYLFQTSFSIFLLHTFVTGSHMHSYLNRLGLPSGIKGELAVPLRNQPVSSYNGPHPLTPVQEQFSCQSSPRPLWNRYVPPPHYILSIHHCTNLQSFLSLKKKMLS